MLQTKIHLDSNGQDLAIEHVQDCGPILEHNKMLRTMEQPSDWGRHVAKIPNVVYVQGSMKNIARETRHCGCLRLKPQPNRYCLAPRNQYRYSRHVAADG